MSNIGRKSIPSGRSIKDVMCGRSHIDGGCQRVRERLMRNGIDIAINDISRAAESAWSSFRTLV